MASIGPVNLEIFKGAQSPDGALVRASYVVSATLDDTTSGTGTTASSCSSYKLATRSVSQASSTCSPVASCRTASSTSRQTPRSSEFGSGTMPMSVLEQGIISPVRG